MLFRDSLLTRLYIILQKADEAVSTDADAAEKKAEKKAKKAAAAAAAATPAAAGETEEAKAKREKAEKKAAKAAKKAAKAAAAASPAAPAAAADDAAAEEDTWVPPVKAAAPAAPATPGASARCFLGNLPYDITDEQVKEFFKECGSVVDLHWLTDKESGQFYGSGFIEFSTAAEAQAACGYAGSDLNGRPVKIEISKPREAKAGGSAQKKPFDVKPLGEKPEGCTTIFMGNLSWDIDEEQMKEWLKDCGAVAQIRWLTDRESGQFKGCGFIDFEDTAAVDKAAAKNGEYLLGRQCRIDYAQSKKKESW
eukprot:SAG22_NODE_1118_length_5518_cov_1.906994_2_plen_309_part_00